MKKHTSFKIGGNAEFFVKAKNIEQVEYVLKICEKNNISLTIIGNGSNILVKDSGIKGIVLKIDINDIDIVEKNIDTNEVVVTVGAGVNLGMLAQVLLKKSISGFEFASGIPGTIGGAIRMNAGAHGFEFKDIVIETTCIDKSGNIFVLNNQQQKFEYRTSIFFEKDYIILGAKLQLKKNSNFEEIKNKMDEYKTFRKEKQPLEYPNAGSTFKRGNDFITAKLIDECGLKGYKVGDAQVSNKHAGFVINTGNASAKDVLELIEVVKKKVYEKFNKIIELEIEVIGEE
ncbi:MAG: UDP-N-acetylmuramate dehydrogenase [Clostridiales bacterium]|nr:UDP-N-acetylmuramate dehydrogenase [Clostridiales bacterium]